MVLGRMKVFSRGVEGRSGRGRVPTQEGVGGRQLNLCRPTWFVGFLLDYSPRMDSGILCQKWRPIETDARPSSNHEFRAGAWKITAKPMSNSSRN
jgi:hypothetical protein